MHPPEISADGSMKPLQTYKSGSPKRHQLTSGSPETQLQIGQSTWIVSMWGLGVE